jgi:hypothetical protein
MPQLKKPLPPPSVELVGQDIKDLATKLRERYPAWARLPSVISRRPFDSVAAVAIHPGILAEACAEARDFAGCYKRYPDQVIEALKVGRNFARKLEEQQARSRAKDNETQSGRVKKFLRSTPFLVRKGGQLIRVGNLKPGDFSPESKSLLTGSEYVPVSQLTDGEVAKFLTDESRKKFEISTDSVKGARQSLASPKGKK